MLYILNFLRFSHPIFPIAKYSQYSQSKLLNLLKNMPKEPTHIQEAQKQRRKLKEKFSKYIPGKVSLQVLGTGANGAPKSLYLFSDQSRYLFNCGEGTQRLAHEHKMKLAKLEHIFVTQSLWKNIGGLPGIALTLQDVGVPEIMLHGPPGLDEIFVATKRFVVLRDLKVHMAECTEENDFQDNVISIKYVPLTKNKTDNDICLSENSEEESESILKDSEVEAVVDQAHASTSTRRERSRNRRRSNSKSTRNNCRSNSMDTFEDDTDYYAYAHNNEPHGCSNLSSIHSQQFLEKTKEDGTSMAYVCRLQSRPGALNLDKCVRMGVSPGPLFGKLKAGEDITLPNGNIVTSKDVCEPDDPGLIFIVVDCPTVDYIDSLLNSPVINKHQKHVEDETQIANLIVHFTPKEVVENDRYKTWMEQFPLSTTHLMLNEYNNCLGSEAVYRIQYKLNLLSNKMFPLLGAKGTLVTGDETECKKPKMSDTVKDLQENLNTTRITEHCSKAPSLYVSPDTFCTYHLRPKNGLDRSMELRLNPTEYIEETFNVVNFKDALESLQQKLINNVTIQDEFPRIVFLGTGSCIPNKTRNTSGILISLSDNKNVILDCGEGTCGQIVRFFGQDLAPKILANIDAIYVSHLHADHHIGLIGLLQGRNRALRQLRLNKNPVYLFAPKQIMAWLYFYDRYFENIKHAFQLVPNSDLDIANPVITEETKSEVLKNLNIQDINTCLVKHCPNAFGVSLECNNGLKLTYSGDTMPSDNLIELGQDSDILIHEATMEDELAQEALTKMHSTTSQAIEVGRKMNAKNIILTHFSQRYAKLPRFNESFDSNVVIAFDNMQISLSDLVLFPELYPALKLMFAEHCEELENKAIKRQMRTEREKQKQVMDSLKRKQSMT